MACKIVRNSVLTLLLHTNHMSEMVVLTLLQVTQKALQSDNDNWRSSNPTSSSTAAPTGAANSSSTANNTTSANSASTSDRPAAAAAPTGPALGMLRAEDVGRQKWQPAKDLESSVQAQQKLRGILNKLTPDNFDRLLTQVQFLVFLVFTLFLLFLGSFSCGEFSVGYWCLGLECEA